MLTQLENLKRLLAHDGPQWVPPCVETWSRPPGPEPVVMVFPPMPERPPRAGRDIWGVRWELEAGAAGGTYPAPGGAVITDLDQWREQLRVPDVTSMDWASVSDQLAGVDRGQRWVEAFVEMGVLERLCLLLGMEAALVACLERPQQVAELVDAIADYKIAIIEAFDDAVGLDMVWYGDDWGSQSSLLLPPRVWRELIKPATARIYQACQRRGIRVNQHSCGRIEEIFGDLVELGADMWNPCQPCNDLASLKRRFGGRITFFGGLDSQHVLGRPGVSEDEVRAEVRRRIDELAAGGGYIASPSHSVPYDPRLLAAMNDEIDRYGRAFYSGPTRR